MEERYVHIIYKRLQAHHNQVSTFRHDSAIYEGFVDGKDNMFAEVFPAQVIGVLRLML